MPEPTTIADAITAAQGRVANAYTAISNKGGTLPATQNLANMPTAIGSIPSGTTPTGTISITSNGTYDVTNYASANVNVSGGSKFGLTIDNFIGNTDSSGKLNGITSINGITFTGVTDFNGSGLKGAFAYNTNLTGAISFPDLTSISYNRALYPLNEAFRNSGITSLSCPNLETISRACSYAFTSCESLTQIDLSKLKSISGDYNCSNMFDGCKSLTSISLPLLETISGTGVCRYMFNGCSKVSSISLPSLTSISDRWGVACGNMFNGCGTDSSVTELTVDLSGLQTVYGSNCGNMFNGCTKLVTISFTSLDSLDMAGFSGMLGGCNNLSTLYFPALTTASFGTTVTQFNGIFNKSTASSSGTCTVHFPSNLSSTISGLTGYPTFGGNSSRIVLAFDLPATS